MSTARRPQRSDSRETVRAILQATERVIAIQGPDEMRMVHVARVAGVAPSTLYGYFPSRVALLSALETSRCATLSDTLQEELERVDSSSFEACVRTVTEAVFDFATRRGQVATELEGPEFTRRLAHALIEPVTKAIDASIARQPWHAELRPANRDVALHLVARLVTAMAWLGAPDRSPEALACWKREVVDMVVRYVVRDGSSVEKREATVA